MSYYRIESTANQATTLVFGIDVCEDCYFAHHYGTHHHAGQWYVNGSDIPTDREPLGLLACADLSDATDADTGEGIITFSSSPCEGCGSTLGGGRFTLALWT